MCLSVVNIERLCDIIFHPVCTHVSRTGFDFLPPASARSPLPALPAFCVFLSSFLFFPREKTSISLEGSGYHPEGKSLTFVDENIRFFSSPATMSSKSKLGDYRKIDRETNSNIKILNTEK